MRQVLFLLCVLLVHGAAGAGIRFANTYDSNMVLQRAPLATGVWGYAAVGEKVMVEFAGVQYTAITTQDTWRVKFAPLKAGGPYTLTATGATSGSVSLTNVMVGEVYICSGQSNMEFSVASVFNASTEIAEAAKYPQIRLFTVGTSNISLTPLNELIHIGAPWVNASSRAVTGFSAVCWFFGRDLADANPGLAIGLISSNWGGTYIQAWSSPEALAKCPTERDTSDAASPNQPSVLWNAMIHPFLSQTVFGALWYQGENNAGSPKPYACQFPAMIADWRAKWDNNIYFFFVQLAPWAGGSSTNVPDTRESQLAALSLGNVGFATAVDLGDALSPAGNIHPRDKQDVGMRLLKSARAIAYKEKDVKYLNMEVDRVAFSSPSATSVMASVTFLSNTTYGGVTLKADACPPTIPAADCENWAFLMSDKKWYPTTTQTRSSAGVSVTVEGLPSGLTPTGLRYAYASWPLCTVFNGADLPLLPFEHMTA